MARVLMTVEEQTWTVLERLQEKDPGADVTCYQEEGLVKILYFQTSYMKRLFRSYCDVLYIDGTYCLNVTGYPLYVFLIIDGEGIGHPVGYALVKDEKMATISCLFQEFMTLHPDVLIKTVIVDKDLI